MASSTTTTHTLPVILGSSLLTFVKPHGRAQPARTLAHTHTRALRETSLIPVPGRPLALPCAVVCLSTIGHPTPSAFAFVFGTDLRCHGLQRGQRSGENAFCDLQGGGGGKGKGKGTVEANPNPFAHLFGICICALFPFPLPSLASSSHPTLHPHTLSIDTSPHTHSLTHSPRITSIRIHIHQTTNIQTNGEERRTVHVPAMSQLSIRGLRTHHHPHKNTPTPSPLRLRSSSTSSLLLFFLVLILSTDIHRADASLFGNDRARLNYDRVSVKSKPTSVYDAEIIAPGTAIAAGLIEATGTLPKQGTAVR